MECLVSLLWSALLGIQIRYNFVEVTQTCFLQSISRSFEQTEALTADPRKLPPIFHIDIK
jgi:hypothetical protein